MNKLNTLKFVEEVKIVIGIKFKNKKRLAYCNLKKLNLSIGIITILLSGILQTCFSVFQRVLGGF